MNLLSLLQNYVLIPSFENAGEDRRTTLGRQHFEVLNPLIKEICAPPSLPAVFSACFIRRMCRKVWQSLRFPLKNDMAMGRTPRKYVNKETFVEFRLLSSA